MQGRTPFVLPGTNQTIDFPPQNRSQPRPPAPDQPPPAPRGLSPVPPNFPQPRGQFTPYIPSQYDRHYSQWGTPDQFGMEPQGWEAPHIAKGVGQFFAQMGSIPMMGIGRNLNQFADEYIKSFMQGKEFLSRQRMNDLDYHMKLASFQQQQELTEIADVVDEYSIAAGTTDPDKLQNFTLNGVSMEEAIAQKARELNDPRLANMAITQGAAKTMEFLGARDKHLRDLQNASKASDKQAEKDAAAAQSTAEVAAEGLPTEALPPSTTAPTGGGDPYATMTRGIQPPASAQPVAAFQTAPAGAQPDPNAQPEQHPLHDAGTEFFRTGREDQLSKDPIKAEAEKRYAHTLPRQLSDIANGPGTPEEKLAKLRALDPSMADDANGYAKLQKGPGSAGGSGGSTNQTYWDALEPFARLINPQWRAGSFTTVNEFNNMAQQSNSPIQRIPSAVDAGNKVVNDLMMIQKKFNLDPDKMIMDKDGNISGWVKDIAGMDPYLSTLMFDWQRYNQDVTVITSGPSVTLTNEAIAAIPPSYRGTIHQYLAAVQHDAGLIDDRHEELKGRWGQLGTGDPMPGYNKKADDAIKNLKLMSPTTGLRPGETAQFEVGPNGMPTARMTPWDTKTGKQKPGVTGRYTGENPDNWDDPNNWEYDLPGGG